MRENEARTNGRQRAEGYIEAKARNGEVSKEGGEIVVRGVS